MTTFRKPRNHRTRRLLRVCHAAAGVRYGMRAKRSYYLYADEGLIAEASQDISLNADSSVTATGTGAGAGNTTPVITTQYGPRPDSAFTTGLLFIKTKNSNGQDTVAYYHHDQLDTPIQATDKAGNIVWAASYNAFGQASIITPQATADKPTITSNLRLPGQVEDVETGLHYNYRRYYDPATGRYVTSDPIGLEGGVNRFAYVEGNPINMIDPTGELIWFAAPIIGAVGSALIDFSIQMYKYGGNVKCVNWGEVAISASVGAVLASTGPSGLLFGRGGKQAASMGYKGGILNTGNTRVGWSWNKGRNHFSLHGGKPRTPGHWHKDILPGPSGQAVAEFGVGGAVAGGTGSGVVGSSPQCGCSQ